MSTFCRFCVTTQHCMKQISFCVWSHRKEFAIVSDLPDPVSLGDGLLVLSESACSDMLDNVDSLQINEPTRQRLLMSLFPMLSLWQSPLPPLDSETLRLNAIALRFYNNSSSLWRFRTVLSATLSLSTSSPDELHFMAELSGFKAFNYHVYNYWLSCMLNDAVSNHSLQFLDALVNQSKQEPSNFSPLHILLTGYAEQIFHPDPFFRACHQLLKRPCPSEALIEFAVSLCLSPNVPDVIKDSAKSIVPQTSLFIQFLAH